MTDRVVRIGIIIIKQRTFILLTPNNPPVHAQY